MENNRISKLQNELLQPIESEVQVVYILARVRKLLEIKEKKETYQFLNFYCNWALHKEINKPAKKVEEFLKLVDQDKDKALGQFLYFSYFHDEFQKFLKEFKMTASIYNEQTPRAKGNFNRLLSQIYSDTPLIIATVIQRKLTLSNVKGESGSYSVLFSGSKV